MRRRTGAACPTPSLVALPARRLWLVEGQEEHTLITPTELFLAPLSLVVSVPLLLFGVGLALGAVPGMLIAVSTGLW
ncbi:hypothetical protein SRB17_73380 [Streptomyces sp. RB17]|uniref:hypothetical protein n=1 Tax=Streptomyces sp. RB17 TaxID=2585197 RepID=UPI0012950449|nr:hypothetical protein [Streptomyces sp. RB17]MQY39316.1 hypothetical protein [Streptomyces sp. RB17]